MYFRYSLKPEKLPISESIYKGPGLTGNVSEQFRKHDHGVCWVLGVGKVCLASIHFIDVLLWYSALVLVIFADETL